jgi:hypothetical protein
MIALLLLIVPLAGCLALTPGAPPNDPLRYRDWMRSLVVAIAAEARKHASDVLIVPQNGESLLAVNGAPDDPVATEYLASINGLGRERLLYEYTADNVPTPSAATFEMRPLLDRA